MTGVQTCALPIFVLNVKDAKELRVTVERVGLFAGDQINLGDARLQK